MTIAIQRQDGTTMQLQCYAWVNFTSVQNEQYGAKIA